MNSGVGSVEGVTDETSLLFGYQNWIGEVQESGKGRRGGSRFRSGPGGGEVEWDGGLGVQKCLQFREEGQGEIRSLCGSSCRETKGLNGSGVLGIKGEVGVEGYAGGFPQSWITASVIVRGQKLFIRRRRRTRIQQCPAQAPKA